MGIKTGPIKKVAYGTRSNVFSYEQYWGKYNVLSLRVKASYNVSQAGLKAGTVLNDVSAFRWLAGSVKITENRYIDKEATHPGANIDGTVIFNVAGARGIKIGDVQFPSVVQYNV